MPRYVKSNIGTGDAYGKLKRLLTEHQFVNIRAADSLIDWDRTEIVDM